MTEPSPRATALARDPVLRAVAVLLSLVHALVGAAWFALRHVDTLLAGQDTVCWPIAPGCEAVRAHLTPRLAGVAVVAYMALGAAAGLSFFERKARRGQVLFAVASVLGLGIYLLDYRLRMNQVTMFAWASAAFFLAPRPKSTLAVLVTLFYVWAGALKLNAEWTSGAALYARPLFVPEALVPAACVYVVVLELVLVWGLFARDRRMRLAVYAQLVLFHVTSFSVVGWFYPLVMFALTAIFPLGWYFDRDAAVGRATFADPTARRAATGVALAFSVFQLVPRLFPGDTAITGEGRIFALHMFDAQVVCQGEAILTKASGERARALLINEHADVRTRCDPIVLGATTQRLCRLLAARDGAAAPRVDVTIDARRSVERAFRPLLRLSDACARDLSYSVFHHNPWIELGETTVR